MDLWANYKCSKINYLAKKACISLTQPLLRNSDAGTERDYTTLPKSLEIAALVSSGYSGYSWRAFSPWHVLHPASSKAKCVTHVSGTFCYLGLGTVIRNSRG